MTASYEDLRAWDRAHVWHPFTQMLDWMSDDPLIISRGEGNYLIDVQGNRYLDGVSSLWCNLLGHNHPHLNTAIKSQLDQIAHSTLLGLSNVPSTVLARKLAELTPEGLTRVFYSDSGSTATEIALKVAFQYWQLRGETQRIKFASLVEAYHGDTLGAVSVGYSELFHHFYRPLLTETVRLIPPHLFRFRDGMSEAEALKAAVDDAHQKLSRNREELAALIVEPLMQGAAGMWAQPVEYVQALRRFDPGIWPLADLRRSRDRIRSHRKNVCLPACGDHSRPALSCQGHDRRLSACGGDLDDGSGFFGFSCTLR